MFLVSVRAKAFIITKQNSLEPSDQPFLVCREVSLASSDETLDDSKEYSAVMDRVYSPTAYSSETEARQLADFLREKAPEPSSRLKALSRDAHAHVLLQLAQQGTPVFHLACQVCVLIFLLSIEWRSYLSAKFSAL